MPRDKLGRRLTKKQLSYWKPWARQGPRNAPAVPRAPIHSKCLVMAFKTEVPVLQGAVKTPLEAFFLLTQTTEARNKAARPIKMQIGIMVLLVNKLAYHYEKMVSHPILPGISELLGPQRSQPSSAEALWPPASHHDVRNEPARIS